MAKRNNRYRQFDMLMTKVVLGDVFLFLLYLLSAATGIGFLKVITAIIIILGSGLCMGYLYLTQELLKKRSLWMSVAFASVLLCTIVSLICNFPGPK